MKTTLNAIHAQRPCSSGWRKLRNYLGCDYPEDKPLGISVIINSNGIDDALWCLRAVTGYTREIRLFNIWLLRQVPNRIIEANPSIELTDISNDPAVSLFAAHSNIMIELSTDGKDSQLTELDTKIIIELYRVCAAIDAGVDPYPVNIPQLKETS